MWRDGQFAGWPDYNVRQVGTYPGGYRVYKISYYQMTKVCGCGCEYECEMPLCPACGRQFSAAGNPGYLAKSGKASSYTGLKPKFKEFAPLLQPSETLETELLTTV